MNDAERWFADTKPALEKAMRRVRAVILAADPRVSDYVKHRTLHFAHVGDLAAFVQQTDKARVTLMFNRGAKLGSFPHLEGDGPTARFMRFTDVADVDARASELTAIVVAWCKLMDAAPKKATAPAKKATAPAKKASAPAKKARAPAKKKAARR